MTFTWENLTMKTEKSAHSKKHLLKCIGFFILTCIFWLLIVGLRPIALGVMCILSGIFWGRMYVAAQSKGYLFFPSAKSSQRHDLGRFAKVVLVLMGFFGALLIAVAIGTAIRDSALLLFGQETIGAVIRQQKEWRRVEVKPAVRDSSGRTIKSAVYEDKLFYDAVIEIEVKEETFEIIAMKSETQPIYSTGSELEVLYFPGQPENGQIKREIKSWGSILGPILLGIFGLVLLGAVVVIMLATGQWTLPEGLQLPGENRTIKKSTGIRYAVGAIIKNHEGEEYLLIHKVKRMETQPAPVSISGDWDFPKGGLRSPEEPRRTALLRELQEETGSQYYTILHEFEEKLTFEFPQEFTIPYARQETTMYLVQYTGDGTDLSPQDEEIDQVRFFPPAKVLEQVSFEESRAFFKKHIS